MKERLVDGVLHQYARLRTSETFWRARLRDYDAVLTATELPRALGKREGAFVDPILAELILTAEDPALFAYTHARRLVALRTGHAPA